MTSDEALEDHDAISYRAADRELKRHGCVILAAASWPGSTPMLLVQQPADPKFMTDWIECTPAGVLSWLGY